MGQSTVPRISAGQAAYLREHESFHLTCVYLNCYGHHALFARDLLTFYQQHHATIAVAPLVWEIVRYQTAHDDSAALRAYADGLARLAQRWGLDRITGGPGEVAWHIYPGGYGYEAIHSWCSHKACVPAYLAAQFGLDIHGGAGFVPQVGEVTQRTEISLAYPDGTTKAIIHEKREPVVQVNVVDYWQPLLDPPAVFKARMMKESERQIDEGMDRLMPMFREADYVFEDTKTAWSNHARWLFRRVAYRESCDAIAAHEQHEIIVRDEKGKPKKAKINYHADSIRKPTKALADAIGIKIPRPTSKRVF